MKKTSLIVGALLVSTMMFGSVGASFKDVPEGSRFFDAVSHLESKGVLSANENFNPDGLTTKAAYYKLMFEYLGYSPKPGIYQTRFTDVPPDSWFAPYIQRAFFLNVYEYNPDDRLAKPEAPLTRAEAIRVSLSLFGIPHDKVVSYGDLNCGGLNEGDPRVYLFVAAEQYGLFDFSQGCKPAHWLTRGETAELLLRINELQESGLVQGSFDVPRQGGLLETSEEDGDYRVTLNLGNDPEFAGNIEDLIDNERFKIFLNVWSRLHEDFVFQNDIDDEELVYSAIKGLVDGLEDPYSEFQIPEEAKEFASNINGNFQGIGASVDMIDGEFTIVSPLKGSPAEKAGLQPNDVVLKVNGTELEGLTLEEGIDLIRGPQGSTVVLTLRRNDSIIDVSVVRDVITLDHIEGQLKNSGVAYLRISSFAADTSQRFVEEMESIRDSNPSGLIIDLRNNPGGYLDATVEILKHFVPNGELIAYIENGDGTSEKFYSNGEGEYADLPIVVLINEGSASASEILAGTLQDYDIAELVGTQSFGKGTVQQVIGYQDGSQLKLSIANWFTAKGRNINHIGLEPDVFVNMSYGDFEDSDDVQLQRAIDMLR